MIISDGTTSVTFLGTRLDDFMHIDKSQKQSSGGNIKSQTSGKRFMVNEQVRITAAQYKEIFDLLTNGADFYTYTPTLIPGYLSSTDFPMRVSVTIDKKINQAWNGEKIYFLELLIEGTEYLV